MKNRFLKKTGFHRSELVGLPWLSTFGERQAVYRLYPVHFYEIDKQAPERKRASGDAEVWKSSLYQHNSNNPISFVGSKFLETWNENNNFYLVH